MECQVYQKLMEEYLEGSLSPTMKGDFDVHLKECYDCREALLQIKNFTGSITDLMGRTTGMLALHPEVQENILSAMDGGEVFNPHEEMMKLFENLTLKEKFQRVMHGLKQPPESGEYKWAKLQVTRLWSPAAAVAVPLLVLCLLALLAGLAPKRERVVNVRIMEPDMIEELEEPEDIPEPEIEPPDPEDIVEPTDNFIPSTSKNQAGPDVDFSPQPAQFDSVAIVKSPVIMKGIFGSRSPGARGSALGRYGGGGHTEGAVLRALRWLKKYQESDGCWKGVSGNSPDDGTHKGLTPGMTGLALLAFLAHGETPASPEFGNTVQKAIQWLLENQQADGRWPQAGRVYADAICGYALCEAYGMTKIPTIKAAASKTIDVVIKSQHPNGGWDYHFKQSTRDDTSVMAWCSQALKAAKMAGLTNEGLDNAMKNAINGFKKNQHSCGLLGYTAPNNSNGIKGSLTGAGVLCMQLLGAGGTPEAKNGVKWMRENVTFDWNNPWGKAPLYCWYYITQAMFHDGGETWREWNKKFSVPMVQAQDIIPKAIQAPGGKMADIGYWKSPAGVGHCKSYTYNTAFCALMLQVYYRYLPTFQKIDDIVADGGGGEGGEAKQGMVEAQDLDIDIQL